MASFGPHETIIQPNQAWLRVDWRLLWEYKDLLGLLIHREFASKYKQTILGPAWFILQPLMTSIVFTIFLGRVAKIPTDGIPHVLFYLCNQLSWNYLQQNLSTGGSIFTSNANLFGKVYFPRLVVPLSVVASNLFACVLQLGCFLAFYVGFVELVPGHAGDEPAPAALLLPLLFLHTAALALGVCLWMSALTAKYRDLNQVLALFVQLWMFASPVLLPALEFSHPVALGGGVESDDGHPGILPHLPAGPGHADHGVSSCLHRRDAIAALDGNACLPAHGAHVYRYSVSRRHG